MLKTTTIAAALVLLAGCNVVLPELDRDLLATFDAVEDAARQRCAAAQNVADCLAVEDVDNMRFMHRMHRMSLTVGRDRCCSLPCSSPEAATARVISLSPCSTASRLRPAVMCGSAAPILTHLDTSISSQKAVWEVSENPGAGEPVAAAAGRPNANQRVRECCVAAKKRLAQLP